MNSFFNNDFEDPKYVAPTSDIGFHWVFGKEGNEELVVQLLNACIDDKEILSVKRLNTEHVVNAETTFRFDLYCECSDGSRVIVECQNYNRRQNFLKRALVYSAMAITDQLKPKLDYKIDKVYFIGLLNYNQFPDSNRAITQVGLFTKGDYQPVCEDFLQIFVELRKLPAETDGDFSTLFLSAIRDLGRVADSDQRYTDARLDRLKRAAQFSSMSAQEQEEYKIGMTTEADYIAYMEEQISDARAEWLAEGKAEGLAEGEARGRAEGKAEGHAEGIAEGEAKAQLAIAINLKSLSLPEDQIAAATGLSIEEIRQL